MSKKKNKINIVYSTNPDFEYEEENDDIITPDKKEQELKVMIDRKQRKGKSVTLITGFEGNDKDIKELTRELKSKCGVGGTTKNGEILIQGELKDKIYNLLINSGYSKTKKVGG